MHSVGRVPDIESCGTRAQQTWLLRMLAENRQSTDVLDLLQWLGGGC
jgi:hypothetical protein